MVLPGPEAQQLAIYIGWLLHGIKGGLASGILFILPGFLSILLLSILYAGFQDLTLVQALFFGIKAAVLAIVIQAVIRIGKRALKNALMYALAAVAFISIFFFSTPFPLIIIGAGLMGLFGSRIDPARFEVMKGHVGPEEQGQALDSMISSDTSRHTHASLKRAIKVAAVWLPLWFVPLAALSMALGFDHDLPKLVCSSASWLL